MEQSAPCILVCDCGNTIETEMETFLATEKFTCDHCLNKAPNDAVVYIIEGRTDEAIDKILNKLRKGSGKSLDKFKKALEDE